MSSGSAVLASSLSSLAAELSQSKRLLKLHFPESAPDAAHRLVPYQIEGDENVCGAVRYRLQCLGNDVHVPLKDLQGQPVAITIGDDRGGDREICGIVTVVEQLFSDGAATLYELEFRDALSILSHRRTWRPFTDMSVIDISERILGEHIGSNPVFGRAFRFSMGGLRGSYPMRAFTLQAGESDADFLTRLWRQEGIAWHFKFALEGSNPVHTLLLADHPDAYPENPAGEVRFHRAHATEEADTVTGLRAWRRLSPTAALRASFDYKTVRTAETNESTVFLQGSAGDGVASTLTDFDYDAPHHGADGGHYGQMGTRRILAHEFAGKGWRGESVVRQFAAGTVFTVSGHPELDEHADVDRQLVLTRVQVYARNGIRLDARLAHQLLRGWPHLLPETGATAFDGAEAPVYLNRFECVRSKVPIVPALDPLNLPRVGMLSAIVVGAAGREVDVDEQGRIAVRFLFTRPDEGPRGTGMSDGSNPCASEAARIRVAHPWADAGFGAALWPRVGSEILIGFLQNHPDKPVALNGGLYNGTHEPPRFSGRGSLPANAALYGFRTKELKADRHNQLRFDDSTAQISTQILSEHAATQLNQGWLGTPRDEGRSEPRGEGFELATDASGAIRTARGLLLSAFQRLNATGKQLSREETLALMEESVQLFKQIGEYAAGHEAAGFDSEPHTRLQEDLKNWENGSNTATGAGGGAPIVAVTAPAGVHLNSPRNVVTHAGYNVDTVALRHIQFASAERLIANAGKGISLFAQSEGVKAIAHQGRMLIQSQNDDTVVNAAKNLKLTASGSKVQIMASGEILLAESGGAYIKLAGGKVEIGCPGALTIKAASHAWSGPASGQTDLPKFSKGDLGRTPKILRPTDGQPIEGIPYELTRSDGSVSHGVTNAEGEAEKISGEAFEHLDIRYFKPKS
jgi:type VI secretion system secreted protein VgrG